MQDDTIPHHRAPGHGRPPKENWRSIASTIGIILAAPLIAIFLTAFVFQSYQVEGPSMQHTLEDRDRLIVWKLGKSWSRLTGSNYVPKRGDIVIFHKPANIGAATESEKQLIKRVVALPGERVVVAGGVVTVYNEDNIGGFHPDTSGQYTLSESYTDGDIDEVVPDGSVYVLGDNRGNSLDSRNFGSLDTKEIVGNLALRLYPFNKFDTF